MSSAGRDGARPSMGLTDDKDFPICTPVGTLSVRQCLIVRVIFRETRISERPSRN